MPLPSKLSLMVQNVPHSRVLFVVDMIALLELALCPGGNLKCVRGQVYAVTLYVRKLLFCAGQYGHDGLSLGCVPADARGCAPQASCYLNKLPKAFTPTDRILVSDPMLATGALH